MTRGAIGALLGFGEASVDGGWLVAASDWE
jgi:hypothetical protein